MRTVVIFGLVMGLLAVDGLTVELKETPIQSQLHASLMSLPAAVGTVSPGFHSSGGGLFDDDRNANSSRSERKSVGKAVLYSIILPGLGEYYVGNRKKARYFFAAEALWWLGYLSYRTDGGWKKDDYIAFAHEQAGANLEGKSDEFVDFVGYYYNIDQYNTLGRVLDRDRPYLVDNASNHWCWQSSEDKAAFREMKNGSREAYRQAKFMIGLMVLNRIVSAIDAAHDARSSRRLFSDSQADERPSRLGCRVEVNPFSADRQVGLTLYTLF
ncbi:MAG: hypothetical protein KAU35_02075 [candidate division Zixibacteria bacterium]|nr:hypothetical protein [candidate division Zixibacteria bacterium]